MRFVRIVIFSFLMVGLAYPNTADAQIWKRVKKRAKERIERKAENKVDKAVDKTVDKAAEGIEDTAKAMVENAGKREAERQQRELELGTNATSPRNAPLIRYRETSSLNMPGLQAFAKLAGQNLNNMGETVTIDALHKRSDSEDQSTILDAQNERMITLNHKTREYTVMTFEEMMDMATSMATNGNAEPDARGEDDPEVDYDFSMSVDRTGNTEVVNGSNAEQMILSIETEYDVQNTDDAGQAQTIRGKFYTVVDMWMTTDLAGYETVRSFQKRVAESMGQHLQQGDLGAMFQSMGQDPRLGASMKKAAEEMQQTEGMPVRSTMYFVLVPKDQELDVAKAMAGQDSEDGGMAGMMQMAQSMSNANGNNEVQEQVTLLSMTTQISDLTTDGVDGNVFDIPAGYKKVDLR